jgi:hypothetical protein
MSKTYSLNILFCVKKKSPSFLGKKKNPFFESPTVGDPRHSPTVALAVWIALLGVMQLVVVYWSLKFFFLKLNSSAKLVLEIIEHKILRRSILSSSKLIPSDQLKWVLLKLKLITLNMYYTKICMTMHSIYTYQIIDCQN